MKTIITATAIALSFAAPTFATEAYVPGYASAAAKNIVVEQLASSDEGAERTLGGYIASTQSGDYAATVSTRGYADDVAAPIFASFAEEDGEFSGSYVAPTVLNNQVANPVAASIFAQIAAE